eukprot:jgi/Galph1/4982/GphlegSOOS_G3600.1
MSEATNGFLSIFTSAATRGTQETGISFQQSSTATLSSWATVANTLFQPAASTVRNQLWQIWCSAKPWSEFANSKKLKPPLDTADIKDRLFSNLRYYLPNYLLLFVGLSCFSVLLRPSILLAVLLVAFLYAYLFLFHSAPIRWGPIEVNIHMKIFILGIVSSFLIWLTGAIYFITSWLGIAFVVAVAHAIMHLPADEPDFEATV